MQIEQAVADAKKWALISGIIGTYGLSKELEDTAILLLVRGHDQAEVLRAVEEVRNSAGAVDQALWRVREAQTALDDANNLLHMEDNSLYYAQDALCRLGVAEVEIVEEDVAQDDNFDDDPTPALSRGRRY